MRPKAGDSTGSTDDNGINSSRGPPHVDVESGSMLEDVISTVAVSSTLRAAAANLMRPHVADEGNNIQLGVSNSTPAS